MRVLVVEDEYRLAEALAQILKSEKHIVDMVHTGIDGLEYALSDQYDVIVLDVMLPNLSGFDVVKRMRQEKKATPVILLTAKDEVTDKVHGLDCGADDYMTKPFSPEELLARIRALSRRQGEVMLDEIVFSDLSLHVDANTLSCGSKSVHLGYKEHEIMKILMTNSTLITTKEGLINRVWGMESDAEDNNVEAYISFLRKKLVYLSSRVGIETIRKVGYRLEEKNV